MSLTYEKCPKCGRPFEDCPCSLGEVEEWKRLREERKRLEKIVKKIARGAA